jgi:hypothetical protein|tara:strand:- start:200 stop:487 length:288 start_codon:yes stop_codon:yes gene_type:complete
MKISRRRLRKLVRAEKQKLLNEAVEKREGHFVKALNQAVQAWMEYQLELGKEDPDMVEDVSTWATEVEGAGNALYTIMEKGVEEVDGMLYSGGFA